MPCEKTQKFFDERGLYLEVTPKGNKWWRLKYRFDGKEKLLSLGVYPEVSLKQARGRRELARKQLGDDIDPSLNNPANNILTVKISNEFNAQSILDI